MEWSGGEGRGGEGKEGEIEGIARREQEEEEDRVKSTIGHR